MKKLFALILAVVMICTMSVSVFATTEHLIGNNSGDGTTDDGSYKDGLAADQDFPSGTTYNVDITAQVGQVQHRYAVDIEYEELVFSITGTELVWNVNTLKYEASTNPAGTPSNSDYTVTVVNYSDLPVDLTVAVADTKDDDFAVVSSDFNGKVELEDAVGVELAAIKTLKTAKTFTVSIKPADGKTWADVANYYTNYFADQAAAGTPQPKVTMGTLSITIAKVTP